MIFERRRNRSSRRNLSLRAPSFLGMTLGLALLCAACGGSAPDEPPGGSASVTTYLEGTFQGLEVGDYPHFLVGRELGPDCDAWGYGTTDERAIRRLEEDADLLDQDIVVAITLERRFIEEASQELDLALTEGFVFPRLGQAPNAGEIPLDEIAAVRVAASQYVLEVSGVGLELRIADVGIHGDEAVVMARFPDHPDPFWERGFARLEKVEGVWKGVSYGSAVEPPSWYLCAVPGDSATGFSTSGFSTTGFSTPTGDPLDVWIGAYFWDEPSVRHGGESGDAMAGSVRWQLEILDEGRGRLEIDGFQTSEVYDVRLEGDEYEVALLAAGTPGSPGSERWDETRIGDTLLQLRRSGYQVLTRFAALEPRLGPAEETWAVRLRR